MGKSSGGGVKVDTSKVFKGLVTPSFSLLPSTSTVTTRQPARLTGPLEERGLRARAQQFGQRDVTRTTKGPFELRRLTDFDPAAEEQRLLDLLAQNRSGLLGLQPTIQATRDRLLGASAQIPSLFAGTASLRNQISDLQAQVEPGFGRLTESLVTELRNREAETQGNLREALRTRRVLGSSFGLREQQRSELDFAQEEERVRSQAFLTEMEVSRALIQDAGRLIELDQKNIGTQAALVGLELGLNEQEAQLFSRDIQNIAAQSQAIVQRVSRELQELGISGNIISQVTAAATQLAGLQAQAAAQEASGFGQLIGLLGGGALAAFGGGLFGGGSSFVMAGNKPFP